MILRKKVNSLYETRLTSIDEIPVVGGSNNKTPPSSAGNARAGESILHSHSLTKGARNSNSVFNMHGEPVEIVARGSQYNDAKSPITINEDLENEKSPLSGPDKIRPKRVQRVDSGSVFNTPDNYSRHNSERRGPQEL